MMWLVEWVVASIVLYLALYFAFGGTVRGLLRWSQ